MDRPEETTALLTEIRDLLREGAKQQAEVIEFMRADSEMRRAVIDRSVDLQEVALRRQKSITWIILPLIAVCLGVLAYLIYRY